MKRDWVDDVAVLRLVKGIPVGRDPSWAEKRLAAQKLAAMGWTATEISQHLHARHSLALRWLKEFKR